MDLRGPMVVFFCWQSLLLAVSVNAITSIFKQAADVGYGGREKRLKRHPWMSQVLLPLVPLLVGMLGSLVIHPDQLTEYVDAMRAKQLRCRPGLVFMLWGAAIGQLSDYLYQRVRTVVDLSAAKKIEPSKP